MYKEEINAHRLRNKDFEVLQNLIEDLKTRTENVQNELEEG